MKRIRKYGRITFAICLLLGLMSTVGATGDTQDVNVVQEVDNSAEVDIETGVTEDEVTIPSDETEDVTTTPEEDESAKVDNETDKAEDEVSVPAEETPDVTTTPEKDNSAKMNASARAAKGDTFTVSGLTYEITTQIGSGLTNGNCELKSVNTAASGLEITIPKGVIWDGVNYWVTSIDENALKTSTVQTVHIVPDRRYKLAINSLTFDSLRYLIFDGAITSAAGDLTEEILPAFREWTQEQGFQNLWWEKYNNEKMGNIKIVFPTYDIYYGEYDLSYRNDVTFEGGLYCNYTYSGTLQFHDENDAHISSLDRPSLIGQYSSIYYVKNGTTWTYDETKSLPDVPANTSGYDAWSPIKGSSYPYKNKSGLGGYYIPPSGGKIYLTKVPEILNKDGSKSKTISKVYDGTETQLLMKTVGNLDANAKDRFAYKFSAGNPKTGFTWNQNLIIPKADISGSLVDKNIKTVKNVGDSTTYTAQLENYDRRSYIGYGSGVDDYIPGWTTPVTRSLRSITPLSLNPDVLYSSEASVIVNITPATATMTPQTTTSLIWNSQTALPSISLAAGSTKGNISWDKDQVPKIGTNDYNYTYVPENATATNVVTGVQTANYTNPKITGKISITYTSQVTGVTITPLTPSVGRGRTQQMSAVVNGSGNPSQEVTWSISGNTSSETKINGAGLLSIGQDETVGDSIIVSAVSKEDNTKSTTTKVTVLQPTVTSITITPANPDVIRGETQQMSATVTGDYSPSQEVTWSISGNTSATTTISVDGLLSVGQDETVGDSIIVTAVSKEDNTKSTTTKVTVLQPTVTGITLTPANPDIIRGGTQQMSATVNGTGHPSQEVTWSISGNTSATTTISVDGLLSIGQDEAVGDNITITAVSKEDNTKSKTGKATVLTTVTSITLTPANPDIIRGGTQQMSATVNGTGYPSQEVTWSISGNTSATTTISEDGLLKIGQNETVGDSVIVKAVSKEDNTKNTTTKVTVLKPTVTNITLTPTNPDIIRGETKQMSAVVTGTGYPSQEVTWSISGNTSSETKINGAGLLSIGQDETVGDSIIVSAVSKEDNTKSTTTKVTVLQPTVTSITLTPANPDIIRGETQQMSAVVTGTGHPSQEVTWSISGNTSATTTISVDGLLSIGQDEAVGDSIIVSAVSKEDNTKSTTTKVTVLKPTVTNITLTPANPDIIRGGTQQMSATVNGTGHPSQEVTWSISGNTSATTTISVDGLLSIGQDEAVGDNIIITAVSKEDNTKSKTGKATVLSPTVTSVTVSPLSPEVIRGDTQQMSATVIGTGNPSQEVTWSISGNTSTTTTISEDGLLKIGKDETPGQSIEVKAIVKIDNSKSSTTKIIVPQPIVTGITLTPNNPAIFRGETQQMSATVEGIGYPSQEVIWSIRGQKKSNTTITQTGLLTIDRIEKATNDIEVEVTSVLDANKKTKTNVVVKERTIIEEIEEYPEPEDVNKDEIKNALNEILDTKRRYENLSKEDKLEMEYKITEELNELVGMLDVVDLKVTNKTQLLIPNVSAKNLAESLDLDDTTKLIQGSHTANIELVVENMTEDNVDQSEKELIQNMISNKTIGMFIDISLYKTLIEVSNPSGMVQTKIDETAQPIKITLDIPEQFRNKKDYAIVRMHKGMATVIDDVDNEPNTITFYTNQFSTYALAYSEKDKIPEEASIDKNVDTSDQSSVVFYQTLLLIGMIGIIGCMGYSFTTKKKRKKLQKGTKD